MLVADASATVELLLGRPAGERAGELMREHDFDLHAPELLDVEVLSAIRRLVALGEASAERGSDAVADLRDMPLERYPHGPLVERAWELRDNFSAYDAMYVALAEALNVHGAVVMTGDARLGRSLEAHLPSVPFVVLS